MKELPSFEQRLKLLSAYVWESARSSPNTVVRLHDILSDIDRIVKGEVPALDPETAARYHIPRKN